MPLEMLPAHVEVCLEASAPTGLGAEPRFLLQDVKPPQTQQPLQIPQTDLVVEVVGDLPVRTKLESVSRLLAQRHKTASVNRTYPPTILELIMLVERNPAKPNGRAWDSIRALTIGYDHQTNDVTVEYCVDYCTIDPKTGAPHPRRKMKMYRAPEQLVVGRVNKKLDDLKKYSAPPFG
jgi:hypothetical protein